ncbi:MAG: sulfatase, partial [Actinobacteria bacterium]|nr:sulfatase [Actinomycetota bacterium]
NLVLVLTDDQSLDSLPHTPAAMPWLQGRLQDPADHWINFSNGFVQVPMCCPSRANILSGQYSHHNNVTSNSEGQRLDESTALATWLDAAGYRTALIGKYLNGYPWNRGHYTPAGWDHWVGWEGPSGHPYYNYDLNRAPNGGVGVSEHHGTLPADYSTNVYRDAALSFLDTVPEDEPFFLYFAPGGPHAPRTRAPEDATAWSSGAPVRTASFNEADVSDKPAWVQSLPSLGPKQVKVQDRYRRDQYGTLLSVDRAFSAIVGAIEAKGQLENTVIVFLSDNGISFGEHRWTSKGCAYEQCVHVPFAVRYPGATARTDARLVMNIDVAPTFAALAGAEPTHPVDGMDLVPLLEGTETSWRSEAFLEWLGSSGSTDVASPPFSMLRTPQYAYMEYFTGEVELYDLAGILGTADPDETFNRCRGNPADGPILCDGAYEAVRAQLAGTLAGYRDS